MGASGSSSALEQEFEPEFSCIPNDMNTVLQMSTQTIRLLANLK